MEILLLIGRIIFGAFFVMSGINHFTNLGMISGYAGSKNVPAPGLAVIVSGVMLVLGGLSVILGVAPDTEFVAPDPVPGAYLRDDA